jgi:tape measure domain-containing protein
MAQEIRTGIKLTGDASGMKAAFVAGERAVGDMNRQVSAASTRSRQLTTDLDSLSGGLRQVASAAALLQLGRVVIGAADDMTVLQGRLKLVTASASELLYVQQRLFAIAQEGRVSYSELGATYAQISRAASELGISQDRMLGVTQTISQTMAISGGSAEAMNAALMQLSQGLASGTLRGEELNSVMEQTPRLAQALADGLGVPRGQLRALAEDGKLTAEAVIGALEKSASSVKSEFGQVATTVSGAMTVVKNSGAVFVAQMDQATGSSASLSGTLVAVASVVDQLTGRITAVNRETGGAAGQFDTFSLAAEGVRVLLETIVVLGANVAYVLKQTGREIGGLAAQGAALLSGDFSGAAAIRQAMVEDAKTARDQIDQFSAAVLGNGPGGGSVNTRQARDDFRQFEQSSQPGYFRGARTNTAAGGGSGGQDAAAAARKLAQAVAAERRAQLDLSASLDRQELAQKERTNEQLYRLGLLDVDTYYTRKAELATADLAISERLVNTELVQARALAAAAKGQEDKARAQAKVLGLQRELVDLATQRQAVQAEPGNEADARRAEQAARISAEVSADRVRNTRDAYADIARLEAETRGLQTAQIRDPGARARAELEAELQARRERIAAITNDNTREEVETRFAEFVVAKQLELNERLKPAWQQMLEDWKDTSRLMKDAYNETMDSMLRDGEQAFVNSGGNLVSVAGSMVTQLKQQLLRLVYRQYVSGFVESLGSSFLGAITGALGGGGAATSGVDYGLGSGGSGLGLQLRAAGGSYGPGLVLRGENGPELSFENTGGYVFNAKDTAQMLGGGGGGQTNITVKLVNESGTPLQATSQRQTTGPDGGLQIEVIVQQIEGRIGNNLANRSGAVSRGLEAGYGVRPAMA